MKALNLTTTLNIKIVILVSLLIVTTTAYNYWLSLERENRHNIRYLISIADFLADRVPENAFSDIALPPTGIKPSSQDQIEALNEKLQPILDEVCIPIKGIKFGFYAKSCANIVALGPDLDRSLLINSDEKKLEEMHNSTAPQLIEKEHSFLWHGEKVVTYTIPIMENGVIVGQAFASINQSRVDSVMWKRTTYAFLGAFIMLLICIVIFHELFVKLKKDLMEFAESIVAGKAYTHDASNSEFAPILNYISEQTEKMTQLDRLNIVGEMAAGLAHEIRNPMTTVKGFLQYLSKKAEFNKQKENFSVMIAELNRANEIITEFLSLSKNKAMDFQTQDLNAIIQDIYPLLMTTAAYHKCKLNLSLGELPMVSLDKNSIHQLLSNMVRNAIDAMPTGGNIDIMTDSVDASVILSIKDSGIGIAEEIKDRLFTPFFTTKDNGTGLGLAICCRIVQRHGAILNMESELGKGTTFTITFNNEPSSK